MKALPSILEKSIVSSYPLVKDSTTEQKNLFVDALIKLLQVKISETEKKEKSKIFFEYIFLECTNSLKGLKLSEIYEAYKMALNGELTLEGKRIEIYAELSNITFSKIIQALKIYKTENQDYLNAKYEILNAKSDEETQAEKQAEKQKVIEFWKNVYVFINEIKFHRSAWVLYDKLSIEGRLIVDPGAKKQKYAEISADYKKELSVLASDKQQNSNTLEYKSWLVNHKKILDQVENKKSGYVIEVCKAYFVSNWIIENKITENEFSKIVSVSEIRDFEIFKENLFESLVFKDAEIENNSGVVKAGGVERGKVIVSESGKFTFIENVDLKP